MRYTVKISLLSATLLILLTTVIISCSKDNDSNEGGANVCDGVTSKSYSANVAPIIQTYCNKSGCHNPGSINGPGPLTNYTEVFNARTLIRPVISSGAMPKDATLSTAQKNSIICWIDSGAPDN